MFFREIIFISYCLLLCNTNDLLAEHYQEICTSIKGQPLEKVGSFGGTICQ